MMTRSRHHEIRADAALVTASITTPRQIVNFVNAGTTVAW
jgi:hypothetical protein